MRKEIFIAIFAGLTIGIVLAFGAWRINSNTPSKTDSPIFENQEIPKSAENQNQSMPDTALSLTNIENGMIYFESAVTLTGISAQSSSVVISDETEDYIIEPTLDGTFEQSINLQKGINEIVVLGLGKDGESIAYKSFNVIYYPDFKDDINTN